MRLFQRLGRNRRDGKRHMLQVFFLFPRGHGNGGEPLRRR
jgi:hypothetical protein